MAGRLSTEEIDLIFQLYSNAKCRVIGSTELHKKLDVRESGLDIGADISSFDKETYELVVDLCSVAVEPREIWEIPSLTGYSEEFTRTLTQKILGTLEALYRPVGSKEFELIKQSDFTAFPPRLPEQPIFYPVTNEEYACQIARDWNTKFNEDKVGYVTKFSLPKSYLDQFERKVVGGAEHEELWIPAEQLEEFNSKIVGKIEVIKRFTETDRLAEASQ